MAGQKTIRIRFDGENKGLLISARGAENALERLQDKVVGGFGRMLAGAAKLANKMAAVATGLQVAGSAGSTLAVASGALLAAPAAAAAYATVLGAVKLGADGAARAQERFTNAIAGVRGAVSDSFERALTPAVDSAARIVTRLQRPFAGIVTQIGGMAADAAKTAEMPKNLAVLTTVGTGTERMLGNLRAAIGPLVQAAIDLVSVAAPGIGRIGAGAGAAAKSFADWIAHLKETGRLQAAMSRGFEVLRQIGAVLADVFGVVLNLVTGLMSGAGGLGGVLGPLLDNLNKFLGSAEGQETLGKLGAALTDVGAAVSAVLMPALQAVWPLLGPLAGLFANVATRVSQLAGPVINFLAPGLAAIARWIERNTTWLGPLAAGIAAATGAMWLLNVALNANPIGLIVTAIGLLILGIVSLWQNSEEFRNFWISLWEGLKAATIAVTDAVVAGWRWAVDLLMAYLRGWRDLITSVIDWVVSRWRGLLDFVSGIPGFFERIGQGIADGVTNGFKSAVNWIIDRLNWLVDRANDLIRGVNSVVPGSGIPSIPRIPGLATGGTVLRGGLVEVGERGRELVSLPAGATVTPHRETEAILGGAVVPEFRVFIGDQELRGMIRVEVNQTRRAASRVAAMAPGGGR